MSRSERTLIDVLAQAALDEGPVRVAYQPVVGLGSGAITGYEALVRGQHLEVGQISPPWCWWGRPPSSGCSTSSPRSCSTTSP